ncbi:MAG: LytTR family transcriptional regulator [Weeksellaceae bacterium]|nr:LytTR family transcriptional regulator [Bacteroidota bacterium]MCG2780674.1 LytTR family transcriptional regulator [Weeksellaceae bacterium]
MNITQCRLTNHFLYWMLFVLFWSFVWGLSDYDFLRNMLIQIFCLPSRMLLVYISLYFLYPMFFLKKKYLPFALYYSLLVLFISVLIQRPFMMYYIQPHYIPGYQSNHFFEPSEIMNTALDINIAAIIPLGYTILKSLERVNRDNSVLTEQNNLLKTAKDQHIIELKIDKSVYKIPVADIEYIESQRNNVRIKLIGSELVARQNISSLQDLLPKEHFVRVHRSFIINRSRITAYSASKIALSDVTVPIGRSYKEAVLNSLGSAGS